MPCQDGQESKRYAIAPSLSWDIAPETNLLLQGNFQNDSEGGYHSGLSAKGMITDNNGFKFPRSFSDSEPTDKFERKQSIAGYQLPHMFNDNLTFQSKFRYADVKVKNKQSYQRGWVTTNPATGKPLPPNMLVLGRGGLKGENHLKSFVLDNNIQAEFTTGEAEHTVVAGVDFQKRKTDAESVYEGRTISPIMDVRNPVYDNREYAYQDGKRKNTFELKQVGVYANDNIDINNWHFKFGARFDSVKNVDNDYISGKKSEWKGSKVSGRLSALYAFENGVSPYISYSTGFNPNTYKDKYNNFLKPTTSKQLEVGVKYQPEGTNDLYSIAAYGIEQKNTANRVIFPVYYTPSGARTSKGVELEARTYINDDWFVQCALSVNRPKFKDNKGVDAVLNGKVSSQAPKWNASIWTNYRFNDAVDASLGVRHVGKQWADSTYWSPNTLELPAYTVVDLGARWKLGGSFPALKGAEVGVNVKNLLDKTYVTGCYNNVNYCYYGPERNIKATFKYQF